LSLNKISARRRYASEQPGEARLLASRKVPKEVSLRGRYGVMRPLKNPPAALIAHRTNLQLRQGGNRNIPALVKGFRALQR